MLSIKMEIGSKLPPRTFFRRFIGAAPGSPSGSPRLEKMRVLRDKLRSGAELSLTAAIPDIHGNLRALISIKTRLLRMGAEVVPMGDAFDTGTDNWGVYQLLRQEKFVLDGNHEINFMLAWAGHTASFVNWLVDDGMPVLREMGIDNTGIARLYRETFEKYSFEPGEGIRERIFSRAYVDHPQFFEERLAEVREHPRLREMFNWLVECGKLYHLDDNGLLYIHGGIHPEEAAPETLGRLDALERDLKALLSGDRVKPDQLFKMRDRLFPYLMIRDPVFLPPLVKKGEDGIDHYLRSLGVLGLVFAHTKKEAVAITGRRIFGIDLGMKSQREGSFTTFGKGGVRCYRETSLGDMWEQTLIPEEEWRANMLREIDLLI